MSLDSTDQRLSTPLHWACYSRSEFALLFCCALGANLEAKDKDGNTPLHQAVKAVPQLESTRSVRTLLLRGAKRGTTNNKGQTAADLIDP
jgi:ankyrin repeat protein